MFGKLFAWLMNDVIVHTLANNKGFQRMAVRMDSSISKNKKILTEDYIKTGEKIVKEQVSKVKQNVPIANVDPMNFAKTFYKEFQKEMGKGKNSISAR